MFVRINKSGKRRYRVVANLGRIDGMEDGHLDTLIRGLCRVAGRDEPAAVEITHAPAKAFGDVFALHELWKDLGFDHALGRALRSGKRKLDVQALVRADLPPLGPSFITRVCGFEIGSRVGRSGQARRARSPQIAQASGALRAASGSRARNAA